MEGGREKDGVVREGCAEEGGIALARCSASGSGLVASEILPLAQAWERAQNFGFALSGWSFLEIHSSSG